MAIYRNIQMSFWTDTKVADDFTPEDRYFYLYLFTNPHTNLCGCYEISIRQMSNETGYSKDTVERLILRFSEIHNVIKYDTETKEVLLINWHKYNWTKSSDFRKALLKQIDNVKNSHFKRVLQGLFDGEDTVIGPSLDGVGTTVTVTDTNTINNNINYKEIIDIYNSICKSLSKVIKTSDKRNRAIKNILKKYSKADLETAFRKAEDSDFLSGRSGSWRCGFDWLLNESNLIKVLEGNYDNRNKKSNNDIMQRDNKDKLRALEEFYLKGDQ